LPIKKVVKKFNFPKNDLIELVLDIENYNEFLPWCKSSKILKVDEDNVKKIIHADLEIGYKLIADTYTSEVFLIKKNLKLLLSHYLALSKNYRIYGHLKKLINIHARLIFL
jgi:coenzyme Q-binding protein COQ10